MSVILLLLGILAAGTGLTALGFGIPIRESELGYTLIVSGATGLSTGLILFGLAAAVHQLTRIAEGVRARPQPRPARPAEPQSAFAAGPHERPESFHPLSEIPTRSARAAEPRLGGTPLDVSSAAIERLRSTIPRPDRVVPEAEGVPLSPNGDSTHHGADLAPEPKVDTPPVRSRAGGVETTREPRLDFLFRSRATRAEQREAFDAVWPKQSPRHQEDQSQGEPAPSAPPETLRDVEPRPTQEDRAPAEGAAPPIPEGPPSVAILKSGVVDGMAYTLYADGSIEAQLPQGTVRFGSITELRAHIESNS
jgi:hypothetical protein